MISNGTRFFRQISVDPDTKCWNWIGFRTTKGYGLYQPVHTDPKGISAHRQTYKWFVGSIPDGLMLDHLCQNKSCVNPKHLEPVTNSENQRRARKSVCKRGHDLTDEANLIIQSNGKWRCRPCRLQWRHSYMLNYNKQKAAEAALNYGGNSGI